MEAQPDTATRLDALMADVRKNLRPGSEDQVQSELAKILKLLPYLRSNEYAHLIGSAEIAIAALLVDKPNVKLAEGLRESIEFHVRPARNPLTAIIRGGTPPTRVILGLGVLLYLALPLAFIQLPRWLDRKELFGIETELLIMVAFAGALGSIVSIMVRIQDFAGLKDTDPSVLFFTGFFKPVIGASFALFIFAAIRSGLIPVTIKEGTERYFLLALAFVAGFSERFARDIVSSTERKVGGASGVDSGDGKPSGG